MAAAGRPLPLLMVCETARGRANFRAAAGTLPMLTAFLERALAGPLTGLLVYSFPVIESYSNDESLYWRYQPSHGEI